MDHSHSVSSGVLSLDFALLANVHLLAQEAHVAGSFERVATADCAGNVWVFNSWLFSHILLLDCNGNLLGDLRLNHFDEELLVLSVYSTSSFAPSARVRSTFLCLPAIASEARNRLSLALLT